MGSLKTRKPGWIGVDLDGTLAEYDQWRGPTHIGKPIPKMVRRVQDWLDVGTDVRIVTARVNPTNPDRAAAIPAIQAWCITNIGALLPLTWEKDFDMIELWDDRCVQVISNTGERADGKD